MAKKETLNPITAFRKANDARKTVVMKSLKKAQEGIVQDTSAAQTLYKNTKPWEGKANFNSPFNPLRSEDQYNANRQLAREAEMNNQNNARMSARAASYEGPKSLPTITHNHMVSDILNDYNKRIAEGRKKKGGPVKRKK